ncbi:methyltransferase domain-containing protein [Candidatus Woesearchaeota archaeon]|nr:methyltransferase domain-containing protein [Candidatus Woesearchaeota archaeon]
MGSNSDIRNFYTSHLKKYGKHDIRAMGWHDEEEYSVRFEICAKIASLENSSVLDIGCGFGGLYRYLNSSRVKDFSYLGIDIMPEMVDIARKKNPTAKFRVGDILKDELLHFDYVFAIGTFNITTRGYSSYFFRAMKKMIQIANKGIAVCFLSDKLYLAKGPYHFENSARIKRKLEKEFNVEARIIDDPRLKGESCLFIYKH